jgi:hypothetical protein
MPESPRTRHVARRRATFVTGDRGRLTPGPKRKAPARLDATIPLGRWADRTPSSQVVRFGPDRNPPPPAKLSAKARERLRRRQRKAGQG